MSSQKPILITGSHRSGSTWVGKVLAHSKKVGYIHEPCNPRHRPGICGAEFNYWFPYISDENESYFYDHINKTIKFKYNLKAEIEAIKNPKDFLRLVKNYSYFLFYRIGDFRPLIKDPIAVFSAEWLASKFDMDVVILIRHPAAFASSLKKHNMFHQFSHFLKQPLLINDQLSPFDAEIREYAEKEHDIIDQAILLWRLIYYVIMKYQTKHNDWIFIRHEDLAKNPVIEFQNIFKKLKLDFTENVRKTIEKYSNFTNPIEAPKASSIKINSKLSIKNWKKRLTDSEIKRIRNKVENISKMFYSDEDW